MNPLKTFLYSLRRSVSDPAYYADVLKAPLSFSYKFFFFFCLLFGLISAITVSAAAVPTINQISAKIKDKAATLYPENLEISLKDKKLAINQPSPYFIPFSFKEWFSEDLPDTSFTNLLVIDTASTNPTKDIKEYQTMALLTADSIAFRGERNEVRVMSWDEAQVDNATFNYQTYRSILDKITPFLKYLSGIAAGFILLFFMIFFPVSKLVHLAVFSLIAMLVSKLMKPKLTYKQTFQIGLHAFTLPTLATEILRVFTYKTPVPFLYSLIFLVYFLLILSRLEKKKA